MVFTKENLTSLLLDNVVTVTFTKTNGEERVMKCTLLSEYIPNAATANQVLIRETTSSNNVSVWDLESNGWRSFRVASVKNVSVG